MESVRDVERTKGKAKSAPMADMMTCVELTGASKEVKHSGASVPQRARTLGAGQRKQSENPPRPHSKRYSFGFFAARNLLAFVTYHFIPSHLLNRWDGVGELCALHLRTVPLVCAHQRRGTCGRSPPTTVAHTANTIPGKHCHDEPLKMQTLSLSRIHTEKFIGEQMYTVHIRRECC